MQPAGGDALYRVLGALPDEPKRSGSGYAARCPAHDDRKASLMVAQGNEGVVLFCHAGCTPEDVVKAVGLEMADLFEKPRNGMHPTPQRWRLIDSGGREIAAHIRIDEPNGGKKFWFERNGKNGLDGLPKAALPLYRLPDLAAAPNDATVYVTEGEKAADAIAARGLLAVGTVTGAPAVPSDATLKPLVGLDVVLWPDNDANGRKHMQGISDRLRALGGAVRWLDWPDAPQKGDAYDYFAAGGTVEELAALCGEPLTRAAIEVFSVEDLYRMEFKEPRWAIPNVWCEGLAIFAGRPKLGKSWVCLGCAIAVAGGGLAFAKLRVTRGEVLYMALEDGKRRLKARLKSILGNTRPPTGLHFAFDWPRFDEGGLDQLEAWLGAHPDCRMVVIDTYKRVRPQEAKGARLYDADYDALAPVAKLALKAGVSIIVVFHTRKGEASDPLELISGTLGLAGAADAVAVFRRERGQADASLFITGRDIEERDLALKWHVENTTWELLGDAEEFRLSKERQDILDLIIQTPGQRPSDVADLLDQPRNRVKQMMYRMGRDGLLRIKEGGRYYPGIGSQMDQSGNRANRGNQSLSPPGYLGTGVTTVSPVTAVTEQVDSFTQNGPLPTPDEQTAGNREPSVGNREPPQSNRDDAKRLPATPPKLPTDAGKRATPVTGPTRTCEDCDEPIGQHERYCLEHHRGRFPW